MQTLTIRASSCPLAMTCPGSVRTAEGEVLIDIKNPEGTLGTAVHDVMAKCVVGHEGCPVMPQYPHFCEKYGVDEDDLAPLVWQGMKAWKELAPRFPNPMIETGMELNGDGFKLTGHADVLAFAVKDLRVLDWKSGRVDRDYFNQMAAYARLAMEFQSTVEKVTATVVWLREGEVQTYSWTRAALVEWEMHFQEEVVEWDGTSFCVGEHCQFCRRLTACPARTAMVKATVRELELIDDGGGPIVGTALVDLYRRSRVVDRLCEHLKELVRGYLITTGPIQDGEGRELYLRDEDRTEIDPVLGWEVMSNWLPEEKLAPAIKVRKGELLKAVAAQAERGEKGHAKLNIMADLVEAGAVSTTTIQKMAERAVQKDGKRED